MPFKGLISDEEVNTITVSIDTKDVEYSTKNSGDNIDINLKNDLAIKLEGRGSNNYVIDKSSLPKIKGNILKRPVNVRFYPVIKEYDGTTNVPESQLCYTFEDTGESESGLIYGSSWTSRFMTIFKMSIVNGGKLYKPGDRFKITGNVPVSNLVKNELPHHYELFSNSDTQTLYGVTIKNNGDGSIILNGKHTRNTYSSIILCTIPIEDLDLTASYTLSVGGIDKLTNYDAQFDIGLFDDRWVENVCTYSNPTIDFSKYTKKFKYARLTLILRSAQYTDRVYNNLVIKPILQKSNTSAESLENNCYITVTDVDDEGAVTAIEFTEVKVNRYFDLPYTQPQGNHYLLQLIDYADKNIPDMLPLKLQRCNNTEGTGLVLNTTSYEHFDIDTKQNRDDNDYFIDTDFNKVHVTSDITYTDKNVTSTYQPLVFRNSEVVAKTYNTDICNYRLNDISGVGIIYKKPIEITITPSPKTYDGTLYIPQDAAITSDVVEGDDVRVYNESSLSLNYKYDIRYPEINSSLFTLSNNITLVGEDSDNYCISNVKITDSPRGESSDDWTYTDLIHKRPLTLNIQKFIFTNNPSKVNMIYTLDNSISGDSLYLDLSSCSIIIEKSGSVVSKVFVNNNIIAAEKIQWPRVNNVEQGAIKLKCDNGDYEYISNADTISLVGFKIEGFDKDCYSVQNATYNNDYIIKNVPVNILNTH